MGYETTIFLVGVQLPSALRPKIEERPRRTRRPDAKVAELLSLVGFTSDETLEFKHRKLPMPECGEMPDDEGFVISAVGTFYRAENFAQWLCRQGFEGSLVQHSGEGDGKAWGWEFKSGQVHSIKLRPKGPWIQLRNLRKANRQ